ncbi:MAG: ABC transporter ATP-binding protein [Xanthomonadaceae bacterium]|nr:ABC transporter ATP-binding protein [Xanthomonadaceae bacterium]MDE2223924.1 ABC transporter ATP-binding protein [Xanthomonadaceae bacterium]MDE2497493.1 ABC transporter ATP-binding protein [Xanthomonadaceae bacterium]
MSSDDFSIRVEGLSKRYEIYARPVDRLKQMILPRVQRGLHWPARAWFSEFWALHDVSFNVRKGETVGIVGRNGSGKSTLLQMICGTLTPTLGTVAVNGRVAALLELGAGFNPEFTGRENVRLSGLLYGLSEQELKARFDAILDFAEIGEFIDQPVKTYSSGMYVRLAFAVAINVSPDVLVLDEALSVGDEAFQRKCFARIDQIRASGATVLFVSHAAGTVIELCNRALLLDRGELLTEGSPKHVVSRYQKLLYSPVDKHESIREHIKAGKETDALEAGTGPPAPIAAGAADNGSGKRWDASSFEEGLIPKSTFRYDSSGASIFDPHIETLDGRRVNILQPQCEYVYAYRVRFEWTASNVRCGMLIRTVTGLELAGCITSWRGESLPDVEAGSELEVRFLFPCLFASGAYFLNAGVQGSFGEENVYLDRWIDGAMFKVIHEPGRLATTTMDLDIKPAIRVVNREAA